MTWIRNRTGEGAGHSGHPDRLKTSGVTEQVFLVPFLCDCENMNKTPPHCYGLLSQCHGYGAQTSGWNRGLFCFVGPFWCIQTNDEGCLLSVNRTMDNVRITPQMLHLNVPTFFPYSAFVRSKGFYFTAPDIRAVLRLGTHSARVFTGRHGEPNEI